MRFSDIPMKLAGLLQHPDPIIINHMIRWEPVPLSLFVPVFVHSLLLSHVSCVSLSSVDPTDQKKTACYDIDVEVDDPLKGQMNSFLSSTTNQQEIAALEMKVSPDSCTSPGSIWGGNKNYYFSFLFSFTADS